MHGTLDFSFGWMVFSFTPAPAIAVEPLKGGSSLRPCQ